MKNVVLARTGAAAVTIECEDASTIKQILNLEGTGVLFGGDEYDSAADARGDVGGLEFRVNGVPSTLSTIPVDEALILIVPKVDGGQN